MHLQVKGKNVEVSPAIRSYAEEKLGKLERQLADPTRVELELAVERNPSIADKIVAEATIWTKGPVLRATERSTDMRASIDLLTDKLERQVTRYRQKRRRRHRDAERNGAGQIEGLTMATDEEGGPVIVKTKQFTMHPMSAEEAVLQLELVGHDFFVFRHEDTGEINVVYRRRDGDYGLIEPS
jgi:putative sigma-54 modulation protein